MLFMLKEKHNDTLTKYSETKDKIREIIGKNSDVNVIRNNKLLHR